MTHSTGSTRTRAPSVRTKALRAALIALPVLASSACWILPDTETNLHQTTVGIPITECANARRTSDIDVGANYVVDWGDGSEPVVGMVDEHGDGARCFSHTYAQAGTYAGTVTVSPGVDGSDQRSLVIEVGPPAVGYISANTCTCHTTVNLSAFGIRDMIGIARDPGGSELPNTYTWTFSDGTTRVTTEPHLFQALGAPGTYQVTLDAHRPGYIQGRDVHGPADARTSTTFTVGR